MPARVSFSHREKEESSCAGTREAWRKKGRQGPRGKTKPGTPPGNRRKSCASPMGQEEEILIRLPGGRVARPPAISLEVALSPTSE